MNSNSIKDWCLMSDVSSTGSLVVGTQTLQRAPQATVLCPKMYYVHTYICMYVCMYICRNVAIVEQ